MNNQITFQELLEKRQQEKKLIPFFNNSFFIIIQSDDEAFERGYNYIESLFEKYDMEKILEDFDDF